MPEHVELGKDSGGSQSQPVCANEHGDWKLQLIAAWDIFFYASSTALPMKLGKRQPTVKIYFRKTLRDSIMVRVIRW
jgi:hypothetical protein